MFQIIYTRPEMLWGARAAPGLPPWSYVVDSSDEDSTAVTHTHIKEGRERMRSLCGVSSARLAKTCVDNYYAQQPIGDGPVLTRMASPYTPLLGPGPGKRWKGKVRDSNLFWWGRPYPGSRSEASFTYTDPAERRRAMVMATELAILAGLPRWKGYRRQDPILVELWMPLPGQLSVDLWEYGAEAHSANDYTDRGWIHGSKMPRIGLLSYSFP